MSLQMAVQLNTSKGIALGICQVLLRTSAFQSKETSSKLLMQRASRMLLVPMSNNKPALL